MVKRPLVYGLSLLLSYVPLASSVQANDDSKPDSLLEQKVDESLKPITLVEFLMLDQANKMIEFYNEMPDELYVSQSSLDDTTYADFSVQPICLEYVGLEKLREAHKEPIRLEGYQSENLQRDAHELFMVAYKNFVSNVLDSLRTDDKAIDFNIINFEGEDITFISNYRTVISRPN
ncbi:MAG: hypothetical protein KKF48_04215 [Nanoarchaeota archaeon]|nr:hypothetical protein [Nanoarchaeota archaeon]MBU1028224.1 hypothetical protein [Nanoarchaeota archaeon]